MIEVKKRCVFLGTIIFLAVLFMAGAMAADTDIRMIANLDYTIHSTDKSIAIADDLGLAEKSDSRYGRSFKQLLVLSQPILQSNLRSSALAKKELKGSAAGAQRSLPG